MNVDIALFLKRLKDNFRGIDATFQNLEIIKAEENSFRNKIDKNLNGCATLIDSFQEYFIETLFLAYHNYKANIINEEIKYEWYLPNLTNFINIFKSVRAAEVTFYKGYPLDGFAQLRDLIDQSIFISAIIKGLTSLAKVKGLEIIKENKDDKKFVKEIKNKRKPAQKAILDAMLFKNADLNIDIREDIIFWRELFHEEVHGSGWSYVFELYNLTHRSEISVYPEYDEKSAGMYANRMCEISWILLRCFPFLQLNHNVFGAEWSNKWHILDESFQFMVRGFDLKISDAVTTFIDHHFAYFPENTFYIERK